MHMHGAHASSCGTHDHNHSVTSTNRRASVPYVFCIVCRDNTRRARVDDVARSAGVCLCCLPWQASYEASFGPFYRVDQFILRTKPGLGGGGAPPDAAAAAAPPIMTHEHIELLFDMQAEVDAIRGERAGRGGGRGGGQCQQQQMHGGVALAAVAAWRHWPKWCIITVSTLCERAIPSGAGRLRRHLAVWVYACVAWRGVAHACVGWASERHRAAVQGTKWLWHFMHIYMKWQLLFTTIDK